MAEQPYVRKNYFIDKQFQTKFIIRFCLIAIVSSIAIGGLVLYLLQNSTSVAIEHTQVVAKTTADFIFPVLIWVLLSVTLVSAGVVMIMTMFMSHKIAGPLFRVRREIDAFKEGDLTRSFAIRSNDQLQEFAQSLQEMSSSMRTKHSELKKLCAEVKNRIDQQHCCATGPDRDRLVGLVEEIDKLLRYFKV